MSKETKMIKREQKAAKKAAKVEKKQNAAYAKLVKKIDKKNAKAEAKANKKGKPFVAIPVPTMEELFATPVSKGRKALKIIKSIVLIVLIVWLIYFAYMFITYVAPTVMLGEEETEAPPAVEQVYDRYENKHEITTTPNYSESDIRDFLKQVVHDNWKSLGYSSDPSGGSINNSGKAKVNNSDCYLLTCGGKTFAVSAKLNAVYVKQGDDYKPLTFHGTDYLDFE